MTKDSRKKTAGKKKTLKTTTSASKGARKKKTIAKKPKRTASKKKPSNKKSISLTLLKWSTILCIWGLVFFGAFVVWFSYDLPDTNKLMMATRKPNITILARDGSVLDRYGDYYGKGVHVKDLPKHVPGAILAIEDRRFYDHFGVDVIGILRAAWTNYQAGAVVQGGSTITQQLAKNFLLHEKLYDHRDRSLRRKVQEVLMALWLEHKFSKVQILTIYLNRVYLGSGAFGIEAAARKYFSKSAKDLSPYEAAVIAGLLKAPSKYSPTNDPKRAHNRAQVVLKSMVEANLIPEYIRHIYKDQPDELAIAKSHVTFARYYTDWIVDTLPDLIGDVSDDLVIKTSLDPRLQKIAEENAKKIIAEEGIKLNAHQTALVAMTPDGAVRALVGGPDYAKSQFNRAVQAKRQTGSVFKLFIFLAALEHGISPSDRISDQSLKIGKWQPKNYGWKSRGDVSVKQALAYSINTCAVRLTQQLQVSTVASVARRLGLTSPQPKDLTMALGSGEANLLELTSAYASVADEGAAVWPYGIEEVLTRHGQRLYKRRRDRLTRVIEHKNVQEIRSMLEAVMTLGTGRKSHIGRPCAGKSGTSQNYKDAWFVGFTPDLVCGVWMGNDNGKSMKKVTGGKLPGKLWKAFMTQAHEGYQINHF